MNVNTSLVTNTSRSVAQVSVDGYRDKISQHIDNDWTAHNSIAVGTANFSEPVTLHLVSTSVMRFLLTEDSGGAAVDTAYMVPALIQNVAPVLPTGSAPVVLRAPTDVTVAVGSLIHLDVYIASSTAVTYQWQKAGVNISGANSSSYDIPSAVLTSAGSYRVVVTNSVGATTSAAATVTVTAA